MKENDEYLEKKVKAALDRIRPYLQADGGDIKFIELTDDRHVKVRLTGACHGCPFSMQTLYAGVEQSLKKEVPEITGIITG